MRQDYRARCLTSKAITPSLTLQNTFVPPPKCVQCSISCRQPKSNKSSSHRQPRPYRAIAAHPSTTCIRHLENGRNAQHSLLAVMNPTRGSQRLILDRCLCSSVWLGTIEGSLLVNIGWHLSRGSGSIAISICRLHANGNSI